MCVCSCLNHDTYDGEVSRVLSDLVTYEGTLGADSMKFSLQQRDDSPLVRLTCRGQFQDTTLKVGDRLLINYVPENGLPYTSGPVSLVGAYPINGGEGLVQNMAKYPLWDRDRVFLYSIWRTGSYINLHTRITYTGKIPRIIRMVVDSATVDSAIPQVYFVHQLDTIRDYHDRDNYSSWDMLKVWERSHVRGLDVHVANTNQTQTVYRFMK